MQSARAESRRCRQWNTQRAASAMVQFENQQQLNLRQNRSYGAQTNCRSTAKRYRRQLCKAQELNQEGAGSGTLKERPQQW